MHASKVLIDARLIEVQEVSVRYRVLAQWDEAVSVHYQSYNQRDDTELLVKNVPDAGKVLR